MMKDKSFTHPFMATRKVGQVEEMKIRIQNGYIMDPLTGQEGLADLLIVDGRIRSIRKPSGKAGKKVYPEAISAEAFPDFDAVRKMRDADPAGEERRIDAGGCIIAPGLMDGHVHFRDPGFTWKEDLQTGSAAAARGGFTTVVCMANTNPVIDEPALLRGVLERSKDLPVNMLQASAVTKGLKGLELVDMEAMAQAGAACFTDDGIAILDETLLLRAMEEAKKWNLPVSLHEEHPMFVKAAGVHHGEVSALLGYEGAYAEAEELLVARDCILALQSGARVCMQHISSARSVELIRMAKKWGADIHAEATPHHFTLTDHAVLSFGTNARMNPPLRTEEDRAAISEGLCDGTLDLIVTDHAPHAPWEKMRPMKEAPSGIIGLETSLSLGLKSLVRPGYLSLMQLLERMSIRPQRFFHLPCGHIGEGEIANLTIFAPDEVWKADHFVSRSSNSPFLGWELPGVVHQTICAGEITYSYDENRV